MQTDTTRCRLPFLTSLMPLARHARRRPSPVAPEPLALRWRDAPCHVRLQAGQFLSIEVRTGVLWLTVEDQLNDCLLEAGERATLHGPACLRLGALGANPCQAIITRQ
ncbi:DUF2917 domain-containing protein [Corticibacter populi]|uniref:DUF2917 domain-containing protein n=1 Tax=Corticibacter populi TaxID=1550736 RepID=A0A3M6QSV6_9BURK|nr:DUF2917 domain-containing protein [Corticibacter populi]RMX05639.1 DUF2917 domain-containing protein [Corticibacter populi]RZS31086.1 DUF2917 family protein [Corticibacter populi]